MLPPRLDDRSTSSRQPSERSKLSNLSHDSRLAGVHGATAVDFDQLTMVYLSSYRELSQIGHVIVFLVNKYLNGAIFKVCDQRVTSFVNSDREYPKPAVR